MDRTFHSQEAIRRLLKTAVSVPERQDRMTLSSAEPKDIQRVQNGGRGNGLDLLKSANRPCQDQK